MNLQELKQVFTKCETCGHHLFSAKQLEHLYMICVEKKHLSEVAKRFNITESTLRRYTTKYKRRFLNKLWHYVDLLKDYPEFDISSLWFREDEKEAIQKRIANIKQILAKNSFVIQELNES